MDLVLFGIQGSGKGTQAKKLAAEFGYDIFETGAELRRIAATDTEIGRTVKSFIDNGKLAPIEVVMEAVKQAIASRPAQTKIIFDGIPRNMDQKAGFDTIMKGANREFVGVQIVVDAELCVQRIIKRGAEQGRADDANEETIRRRMGIFTEQTIPVIEVYRAEGKMTDIDGEAEVDDVYLRLKAAMPA